MAKYRLVCVNNIFKKQTKKKKKRERERESCTNVYKFIDRCISKTTNIMKYYNKHVVIVTFQSVPKFPVQG